MNIAIAAERPDTADASALVLELEAELAAIYPSASRHGYSVQKLVEQQVHFFVLRVDGLPVGCGGIQFFGRDYGELKRMYVRPAWRGRGLSRQLVEHLCAHALAHGLGRVRLETGVHQHAAIALYERSGFHSIPLFGTYEGSPHSLCYERVLT